jgi:hypothetical protein
MTESPEPPKANGPKGNGTNGINGMMKGTNGDAEQVHGHKSAHTFQDLSWEAQAKQDDEDIQKFLNSAGGDSGKKEQALDLATFGDKALDQTEKADDAIDFEDISDDDLPSEHGSEAGSEGGLVADVSQVPGLTEDSGDSGDGADSHDQVQGEQGDEEMVDLFGEDLPPSSPRPEPTPSSPGPAQNATIGDGNVAEDDWNKMSYEERFRLNFPQQESNSVSAWITDQTQHQDPSIPIPPQNIEELIEQTFPSFAPHKILNFRELFPEWPADYVYKEPPKSPPELVPTKLELDIDADTAKLFRIPDTALAATQKRSQQQHGEQDEWSRLMGPTTLDVDDFASDTDDENEIVGGYTLTEFATICEDWDNIHEPKAMSQQNGLVNLSEDGDEAMDDWDREFLQHRQAQPKKKRKFEPGLPNITSYGTWGLNHYQEITKRYARRVQLDLNDPYLLIEDVQSERPTKRPRLEEKTKRMANGQLGRDPMHRFNVSNDEAYNALKANHKSKVRATLSNLAVEHSLPALKLTFPFYRTKTEGEFWEHHRKKFNVEKMVRQSISFRKPSKTKRRDTKGRSIQEIFKTSKDLSLNDNSTAILFEYCEPSPVMLNNYGMGSRVINYHRRRDHQDEEKLPKAEIGEPHFLLPEDRSPFSIFGTVDPGETVPTLHNEMYRAPIFKHESRMNDFLLGFSTTATETPKFYLRTIDHIYVVGQTFPSLEVPGPHARKVTNTTKNRLKMISYRMMRKRPRQDVDIREITPHVFDKQDPQNR